MNRCLQAMALFFYLSPGVEAGLAGHGHVRVQGSIVDTACSIATGDRAQGVEIGTLPASELVSEGHGPQVDFTIHLVNCILNGSDSHTAHQWKDVHITFDGAADGNKLFAMRGTGSGQGVAILDEAGVQAEPGKSINASNITPGNMTLHYRIMVVGDHHPLHPGKFFTTIRFFLDYE